MKDKLINITKNIYPTKLTELAHLLMKDEAIGGKLILMAVALALVAANTPLVDWYNTVFHTRLALGIGQWVISLDLRHWISEGLMTFFFLVAGLELKRELVHGELRQKRTAILPIAAAVGGMVFPACLFVLFNISKETMNGWAIPTATDIALALGILALLGNRIPSSIRIFLLALAIVDDVLAVTIIAIFYNGGINTAALVSAACLIIAIYMLGKFKLLPTWGLVLSGGALWLTVLMSGVHPSIAGAVLGFTLPIIKDGNKKEQIADKVERHIIPFTTLIVVPLFAFASTGIVLTLNNIHASAAASLGGGIFFGLVAGKFLGIYSTSWLMVKLRFATLPTNANWRDISGVAALSGIGFTVAIFLSDLAFTSPEYVMVAKISIILASFVASISGLFLLRSSKV